MISHSKINIRKNEIPFQEIVQSCYISSSSFANMKVNGCVFLAINDETYFAKLCQNVSKIIQYPDNQN